MEKTKLRFYFLSALLVGVLIVLVLILRPFLAPLALAAIFAVVLHPMYRRVLPNVGHRPSIAALLVVVGSAACVLLPLSLLGAYVFEEMQQAYGSFADGSAKAYLDAFIASAPFDPSFATTLSANLETYVRQGLAWLVGNLDVIFSSVADTALALFVFLIAFFYLLRDGTALIRTLIDASPLSADDDTEMSHRLSQAVHSVIVGNLSIGLIQGAVSTIGYLIFGLPNAILWGVVTAFAALVPGVGTALVFIPAVLFLLIMGTYGGALGLTLWGVLAVGLIDNMLGPRLIGRGARLHPLLILLSVLGGIAFFGPVGIFLGPLTVSFCAVLISLYASSLSGKLHVA